MRLRKNLRQLAEANNNGKPIPLMTLLERAMDLANRVAMNEAVEDDEFNTEEGLDEFSGDDADEDDMSDEDFDDDDLDAVGDGRETVTITIPVDATLDEITSAIAEAQSGASDEEAALDAEATAAAEDAADDIEAGAAAEEAADEAGLDDDEDFDDVEEDEEAFASTRAAGPVRKPASTSYTNKMTVDSNIRPVTSMGKPATIADGSPKRQPASTSYDNNMTIKSRIQKDTRWYQS